jgi:hypothetical protein
VDGKRLKGIGTRASKSRLTSFQRRRTLLECLSTCRKEDKKGSLASFGRRKGSGESVLITLLDSSFRLRGEERFWEDRVLSKKKRRGLGVWEFGVCRRLNEGLNDLMWRSEREKRECVEMQPDKSMVC